MALLSEVKSPVLLEAMCVDMKCFVSFISMVYFPVSSCKQCILYANSSTDRSALHPAVGAT